MINLTVDIGNSSAKAALFEDGRLVRSLAGDEWSEVGFDRAIVASTGGTIPHIEGAIVLDHSTPVPIKNLYGTPETLGCDRLAAAVGAVAMFPGRAVLVCDFGTAITYDLVTAKGEFLGGNISPGAGMRFRALHEMTVSLPLGRLPYVTSSPDKPIAATTGIARNAHNYGNARPQVHSRFPSRDTKSAIENGVVRGIVAETEAYIEAAKEKFNEIKVIFTGGDADYFAGLVNFPIFATSDLVFYGLNAILDHNAKK